MFAVSTRFSKAMKSPLEQDDYKQMRPNFACHDDGNDVDVSHWS
jgi:hypothetical protein